jgi:ATPase subunit of ABC transporter with duplicated ATPase domains
MNRVVRGSSLLIVTAIVAACAAKRDEDQQAAERQQGPDAKYLAKDEDDARRDKAAEAVQANEVVLDIQQVGPSEMPSRAYPGRFNFKGHDQQKMVGTLSGGERGRLHLA